MDLTLEDLAPEDRKVLPRTHPLLDDYATRMNDKYKLPPHTLLALKNAGEMSESTGGPGKSISPKGAVGVMQFMPGTAKRFNVNDAEDPVEAIDGAGRYGAHIMTELNTQDPGLIAAGYNAGENRATLRAGRVPMIPETQSYVKRVKDYIAGRPTAPAAAGLTQDGGLSAEDLDPADRKALARVHTGQLPAELSPLSESSVENALAGAGKLLVDTGTGAAQLVADTLVNPVSRKLVGRDLMDNRRAEVEETNARDEALMGSKAGLTGYLGNALLTSALPASWLGKAGLVTKGAAALSKVPAVGGALSYLFPSAVVGGGMSAASPVTKEGERAGNMATGAVVGPLATVAGAGLGKLGNTTAGKDVIEGAKFLASKAPSVPGFVVPSWNSKALPGERKAVQAALDNDVPVYGSQLRNPGAELPRGRANAQKDSFDRAIARSFGEDTDDLVQAFPNAQKRMGDVYNNLFDGKAIPLDKSHLADLKAVSAFNNSRSPRFPPNSEVDDLVQRAVAAATQSPTMTGRDYQNALQQYKTLMTQFGKSTDTKTADHHAMEAVSKLIDSLNNQASKVLSPEELKLFQTTNKQWRNMTQLETLAPKDADGNISPKQLANLLARKRKGEFVYGKGDQTLPDLARYGNTYMGLTANAPKGFIQGTKKALKDALPYGLAAVGEGTLVGSSLDHGEGEGMVSKMTPYAVGIAAAALANKGIRAASNPRLTKADLARPRGALSELSHRADPAAAAALTANAWREE